MLDTNSNDDVVEVLLSENPPIDLEDELRLIKELAYPRPVVAKLPDSIELNPLLEQLAVAGLSEISFNVSSSTRSNELLRKANVINKEKRLGLRIHIIKP